MIELFMPTIFLLTLAGSICSVKSWGIAGEERNSNQPQSTWKGRAFLFWALGGGLVLTMLFNAAINTLM